MSFIFNFFAILAFLFVLGMGFTIAGIALLQSIVDWIRRK
jgi:hypothetical protein